MLFKTRQEAQVRTLKSFVRTCRHIKDIMSIHANLPTYLYLPTCLLTYLLILIYFPTYPLYLQLMSPSSTMLTPPVSPMSTPYMRNGGIPQSHLPPYGGANSASFVPAYGYSPALNDHTPWYTGRYRSMSCNDQRKGLSTAKRRPSSQKMMKVIPYYRPWSAVRTKLSKI